MKASTHARLALHRRIENLADDAEKQSSGAPYVIYVILDPTRADPLGTFGALPIYVGVSSQIGRRVKQHFRRAAYNQFGSSLICARLRRLLLANVVAEFQIVDRLENKVDAMIAETAQAQAMLRAGYRLCNRWYFQRQLLTDGELEKVIARIRYAAAMEAKGWT